MDPNVISNYRKALSSKQLGCKDTKTKAISPPVVQPSFVNSLPSSSLSLSSSSNTNQFYLPRTEDRIILYYTSLRGIRRTYEDYCAVKMIFRCFRVCVVDRDISMDSTYRKELQSVLGGKLLTLPRVFVWRKYVGGVDEIKQLHEAGELAILLKGFQVRDVRFVPCLNCNGSWKVFKEKEGRLRRCSDCNENGLIQCPSCCP